MRVLLDECVPRKLCRLILGHNVMTVPQAGLAGLKNGALLSQAAGHFDALVTTDRGIPNQQNLQASGLALVVLVAISNRYADLAPLVPQLLAILPSVKPGNVYHLSSPTAP